MGLLSLGLFISYALVQEHRHMERQEIIRLQTQVKVVAENLRLHLEGLERSLTDLFTELPPPWTGRGQVPISSLLRAYSDSMPMITKVMLANPSGTVLVSSQAKDQGTLTPYRYDFQLPFAEMNPAVLYFSSSHLSARGTVPAVAKVFLDGATGARWVAIAILNLDYIQGLLDSVRYRQDVRVAVAVGGETFFAIPEASFPREWEPR